jgi:hypothetical protein
MVVVTDAVMIVIMKLLIGRLGLAHDVAGSAHLCVVCCWSLGGSMILLRLMMKMTIATTIVQKSYLGCCTIACQSAFDSSRPIKHDPNVVVEGRCEHATEH